ncbi:MAG: pimeloyl-ACP methyl ester carboxylesterase [Paracoccaceae bacterium]|jgi:pimeloyl-ACP methyl ester carboxylesterase
MASYSRLMEAGEDDVLARQRHHRKVLIDPAMQSTRGRIVKSTGDGVLAEFASVGDAVRCALDIQAGMIPLESAIPEDRRIRYRIGINVGDVVVEDGDIFGDDVNVAARLEQLAEPGGVCISDTVYQMIHSRTPERFADLGSQSVKNIQRPIRVWQWTPQARIAFREADDAARAQQVEFCIAPDGAQLAYATIGQGPAVLKAPNWLNHLEYDWSSPIWGPLMQDISRQNHLVRFDQRGNGLSDWHPPEISEAAMLQDMETVVAATGIDKFAIFAASQGSAFAVRYAAEHPDRVSCIVILGEFVRGALKRGEPDQAAMHEAMTGILRHGWGSTNPAYRNMFTESLMPDATAAQKSGFDELQRVATSPENAARINDMNAEVDVTELARQLTVPVLVMHSQGDKRIPLEEGRRMAALIPGARFQTLPGNNHMLVSGTPGYDMFLREFHRFVDAHAS